MNCFTHYVREREVLKHCFSPKETVVGEDMTDEVQEWCEERFGGQYDNHTNEQRWYASVFGIFYFAYERDALEFKLRWC